MPLVLAVEPDPRQIAHVTSLTRGRPRTELVIAESTTSALSAIAARVPDVLLVSPQLSHEDQTRIADCLTRLGRAAAHFKMLTTPRPAPISAVCHTPTAPRLSHGRPEPAAVAVTRQTLESTGRPIQDEWGFFDPGRCGFSALSKLEEPAVEATTLEPHDHALVRVIPY
jgi:hypothetical protein